MTNVPKYRRGPQRGTLTAFAETLKTALNADAHRSKHEHRTGRALYAEARAANNGGGYSRVTAVVRARREGKGQLGRMNTFVPMSLERAEAYPFDGSEQGRTVGDICRRIQVSPVKLCTARAF